MIRFEHGTYLSDATLRLMKERGVFFTPTMEAIAMDSNSHEDKAAGLAIRSRAMIPRSRETVRHALAIGVRVVAGTDSSYYSDSYLRIGDELQQLASVGMSPLEVIRAATSRCAECIGVGKRTGTVRPGLEADLIVLDRNPLEDIGAVRDVRMVVNDGVVAIDSEMN